MADKGNGDAEAAAPTTATTAPADQTEPKNTSATEEAAAESSPKNDADEAEAKDARGKKKRRRRNWLPLESNPDVLSRYARALGAPPSTSFADVYGLEDDLLAMVPGKALALLLLFPITRTYEERRVEQEKELSRLRDEREKGEEKEKEQETEEENEKKTEEKEKSEKRKPPSSFPYFTRQTIGNACGTVGLIHSFASIRDKFGGKGTRGGGGQQQQSVFAPGSFFERFYSATSAMTADERAEYLECPFEDDDEDDESGSRTARRGGKGGDGGVGGDDDEEKRTSERDKETRAALAASIDAAHAAAASAGDTRPPGEDESVDLHFVAFVETGGRLWELDGRKVFPVDHGTTSAETMLRDAAAAIKKEFVENAAAEGSINFNLLALVEGGGEQGGE